jgi:electron transport complex protein RnfG
MKFLKQLSEKLSETAWASLLLASFALLGVIVLASLNEQTRPIIEANEKAALLNQLNILVKPESYTNDITQSIKTLDDEVFGTNKSVTVHLAKDEANQPVAAIFIITTMQGYSGAIKLIVAVNNDQTLAGVRTLAHKETPGLGDKIEATKHDWIKGFTHKSLNNPTPELWAVKKDGGDFDQFTGATITPRAVVNAVKTVLLWSQDHFDSLFIEEPNTKHTKGD